jgi:hypothetical protein
MPGTHCKGQPRNPCTIIPIHAADAAVHVPTLLLGDAQRLQPLLHALAEDVQEHLPGMGPPARWLRELRLGDGEAYAFINQGLGHDGLEAAEIAFDTMRRLLPDTDIYVSAAPG